MSIEMIQVEEFNQGTQIKVIGVGGGEGLEFFRRGGGGVVFLDFDFFLCGEVIPAAFGDDADQHEHA